MLKTAKNQLFTYYHLRLEFVAPLVFVKPSLEVKIVNREVEYILKIKRPLSNQDGLLAPSLAWPLLSQFSWAMKIATTNANQETTRARNAG